MRAAEFTITAIERCGDKWIATADVPGFGIVTAEGDAKWAAAKACAQAAHSALAAPAIEPTNPPVEI